MLAGLPSTNSALILRGKTMSMMFASSSVQAAAA